MPPQIVLYPNKYTRDGLTYYRRAFYVKNRVRRVRDSVTQSARDERSNACTASDDQQVSRKLPIFNLNHLIILMLRITGFLDLARRPKS
jgi:hypothetical protein